MLWSVCRLTQTLLQAIVGRPQGWQAPAAQIEPEHTVPHVPQLDGLLAVETSHPLVSLPSQFAKPGRHWSVQTPRTQVLVALIREGQALPHMPQSVLLALRSTSHPLVSTPSQLAKPGMQVSAHRPALQLAMLLAGDGHAMLQPPQCAVLVVVSTQDPPQRSAGAVQPLTQRRAAESHTGVAPEHCTPQPPQLLAESSRVSHPLVALVSQSAKPALHVPTRHCAEAQAAVALGSVQLRPQAPQWFALLAVLTSQPLPAKRSQSAKPLAHAREHAPAAQRGVPLVPVGHRWPHIPQCSALLLGSTQRPAQLSNPAGHVPPVSAVDTSGDVAGSLETSTGDTRSSASRLGCAASIAAVSIAVIAWSVLASPASSRSGTEVQCTMGTRHSPRSRACVSER